MLADLHRLVASLPPFTKETVLSPTFHKPIPHPPTFQEVGQHPLDPCDPFGVVIGLTAFGVEPTFGHLRHPPRRISRFHHAEASLPDRLVVPIEQDLRSVSTGPHSVR